MAGRIENLEKNNMTRWIIITRFGETMIYEADDIVKAIHHHQDAGYDSDQITTITKITDN